MSGWPSITRELLEFGYSPGAIGKAFLVLSTGGTVAEAREALESYEPLDLIDGRPLESTLKDDR